VIKKIVNYDSENEEGSFESEENISSVINSKNDEIYKILVGDARAKRSRLQQ
jgi:hypothetical protein